MKKRKNELWVMGSVMTVEEEEKGRNEKEDESKMKMRRPGSVLVMGLVSGFKFRCERKRRRSWGRGR